MDYQLDLSPAWASTPPIVYSIFQNFSAKQLNTCAQVCTLWNSIAKTVKKHRKSLSWNLYIGDEECGGDDIPNSCKEHLNEISSEPNLALIFCADPEYHWDGEDCKKKMIRAFSHPVRPALFQHFPPSCDIVYCSSDGITGTSAKMDNMQQLEEHHGTTGVYFPTLPGVCIHRIDLGSYKRSDAAQISPLRCLLVFNCSQSRISEVFVRHMQHLIHYTKGELAIGGAQVQRLWYRKNEHMPTFKKSFALAFSGENVKAASIIIPMSVETSSEIEEEMKKFSETDVLESGRQCVAFAFTCIARGEGFFEEPNVESDAFRKLYPSIPLFGVFGKGEIGVEYLPNVKKAPYQPLLVHSYSSIYVLISVKC